MKNEKSDLKGFLAEPINDQVWIQGVRRRGRGPPLEPFEGGENSSPLILLISWNNKVFEISLSKFRKFSPVVGISNIQNR